MLRLKNIDEIITSGGTTIDLENLHSSTQSAISNTVSKTASGSIAAKAVVAAKGDNEVEQLYSSGTTSPQKILSVTAVNCSYDISAGRFLLQTTSGFRTMTYDKSTQTPTLDSNTITQTIFNNAATYWVSDLIYSPNHQKSFSFFKDSGGVCYLCAVSVANDGTITLGTAQDISAGLVSTNIASGAPYRLSMAWSDTDDIGVLNYVGANSSYTATCAFSYDNTNDTFTLGTPVELPRGVDYGGSTTIYWHPKANGFFHTQSYYNNWNGGTWLHFSTVDPNTLAITRWSQEIGLGQSFRLQFIYDPYFDRTILGIHRRDGYDYSAVLYLVEIDTDTQKVTFPKSKAASSTFISDQYQINNSGDFYMAMLGAGFYVIGPNKYTPFTILNGEFHAKPAVNGQAGKGNINYFNHRGMVQGPEGLAVSVETSAAFFDSNLIPWDNYPYVLGVLDSSTSANDGDSVDVAITGIFDTGSTDLGVGYLYYAQPDATIGLPKTSGVSLGKAVTNSKLNLVISSS